MKQVLFLTAILGTILSSCNDNNSAARNTADKADTISTTNQSPGASTNQAGAEIKDVVSSYLTLKNALVGDNGKDAASAGKQLSEALKRLDEANLPAEQRKIFDEVKEDAKEHAEHISTNASKIAHQREHFGILSQDIYDFVKTAKADQTLYKVHCPMYNDNKGAFWLSEVREVKNPYYGKEMLNCGSVVEEVK